MLLAFFLVSIAANAFLIYLHYSLSSTNLTEKTKHEESRKNNEEEYKEHSEATLRSSTEIARLTSNLEFQIKSNSALESRSDNLERENKNLSERLISQEVFESQKKELWSHFQATSEKNFSEVGNKLLNKNHEKMAETNKNFMDRMAKMSAFLEKFHERIEKQETGMQKVLEVFGGSHKAGKHAELHLENRLRSLGLQKDQDYYTQFYTDFDDRKLLADCVIKIPNGTNMDLIVIDCKSSLTLFEDDIKGKMNSFEKSLSIFISKEYARSVRERFKSEGKSIEAIYKVIYVPADSIINLIQEEGPSILDKARAGNIFIVGPTVLEYLLYTACGLVKNQTINAAYKETVSEMQALFKKFGTVIEHIQKVGKGVQQSATHYSSFANSFNSRLLPSMKRIYKKLNLTESKALTEQLPSFTVSKEVSYVEVTEAEPEDNQAKPNALLKEDSGN